MVTPRILWMVTSPVCCLVDCLICLSTCLPQQQSERPAIFCCSPPEDLVLPRNFPRVPFPALAALLAPLAWSVGAPDLFDSYSAGVILIQLAGEFTE